jgi:carboxyl-terminal processing protease
VRRLLSSLAVTGALVGAFAVGLSLTHRGTAPAGADTILAQVRAALRSSYYRPVPANVLRQPSVSALLRALDDPYTEYLDPTQFRLLRRETRSSYPGIGVGLLPVADGLRVVRMKAGPAERAGIRVGDVILAINGFSTADSSFEQSIRRLLGPTGTTVKLRLRRGEWVFDRAVIREQIEAPAVHARLLAAGKLRVGYVKLSTFSLGAAPVLKLTLAKLRRANIAGIVLDLRGNPGGLFDQAVAVASAFLDHGVIVTIDSVHQKRHTYAANGHSAVHLPLVVLVDRDSASSAEIVAAALHDNRRAVLVGEHTFGKGLIQQLRPLPNGAALRITTARYLTPSGEDINARGVSPDLVAVDDPRTRADETLQAALQLFLR